MPKRVTGARVELYGLIEPLRINRINVGGCEGVWAAAQSGKIASSKIRLIGFA